MKLAAAPISWGVCEVPGWGHQLAAERVLADASRLGFEAIELGPPGFLPTRPEALARHGLRVIAAFVTGVLHDRSRLDAELASIDAQARTLAALGGTILVLAAASGHEGYDAPVDLSDDQWRALFDALPQVCEVASRHGLAVAFHPHVGTAVETAAAIDRLIRGSDVALCLDTGHVFVGGADPVRVAREWPQRVAHVHLKDANATLAAEVRARRVPYVEAVKRGLFRRLGDGDAHIADVLGALRDAGYDGWYVLEQDIALAGAPTEANDPVRDIARSRDFARAHA
jgi:inosose dehydratase